MYQPGSLHMDELDTSDTVEVCSNMQSTAYCQLQLATALHWDETQRKMILLEQILARNDVGKYNSFEMRFFSTAFYRA